MNLWHKFQEILLRDLYTYEERQLLVEQTRRLKLATDLQAKRIEKMRKRAKDREKRAAVLRPVATWRCSHIRDGELVYSLFSLSATNSTPGRRQVEALTVICAKRHKVLGEATLSPFIKSTEGYRQFIHPWVNWQIDTEAVLARPDVYAAGEPFDD